jgi:UDP-N-acetylmuramate dehydrogenase
MFQENISLAQYSSYKIGGKARYFCEVKNVAVLKETIQRARAQALPIFILAGGTNVLVNDDGFPGLIIKPNFDSSAVYGNQIYAEAGLHMKDLLDLAIHNQLSGLEWAGGLPGSLGGAVRGNAGAFSGEMKDLVIEVTSLDISHTPQLVTRVNKDCAFGYRTSIFKEKGNEIIISAKLLLSLGNSEKIKTETEKKIQYRNERHPMEYPNAGSMFKNIKLENVPEEIQRQFKLKIKNDPFPVLPAAVLIAAAGLSGISSGGAMISPKHPNFIVNTLNATASDVKQLVNLVKSTIQDKYHITLEEEIMFI